MRESEQETKKRVLVWRAKHARVLSGEGSTFGCFTKRAGKEPNTLCIAILTPSFCFVGIPLWAGMSGLSSVGIGEAFG